MGVAEHKRRKNEACSRGIVERYAGDDFVGIQVDAAAKIVAVPRPAGVVLALTPSTNPIATVYFKVLLALMTRNAVVVSPHPLARKVSAEAVHLLAEAAVAAGAPDGCLQVVEEPTIPLIEALMGDDEVDVIVATGGTAVVRAAYRSGNPSLGVGPGNVPALVDATADVATGRALPGRLEGVRQLDPVHERVGRDRRGARGGRVRARAGASRRARARRGRVGTRARRAVPRGADRHGAGRQGCRRPGRGGRDLRAGRHPRAGGAVPADRARGAARAREAVPAARAGARARRRARDRRGARAAADRRRRPLGGDPLARPADDPGLRRRRARAARGGQRARQHRLGGPRHQPGADDDDRHRVLRALEPDREPRAAPPDAVDPRGLRDRRAVRRLRRACSRGRRGPSPRRSRGPPRTGSRATTCGS